MVAHVRPHEDGVTGFLIFDKTWFVQILEGERARVTGTYDRIARDPRHADATVIDVRDVPERLFPNWTMGGAMRTPEVQEVYLQHGFGGPLDPVRLKSGQVVDLALDLQAFETRRRQGQKLAG